MAGFFIGLASIRKISILFSFRLKNIFSFFWLLLLLVAFLAYMPGLQGSFLFDDFTNLKTLGDLGGIKDWYTFQTYLSSGFSGPTGRPLSLLSFLMDATNWPAHAYSFKLTNVLFHLLAATLLWRLTRQLVYQLQPDANPIWIEKVAIFSAAIWLLHPFLLSTTLYVVQRMAQLAAIFALAGIWLYLIGRNEISKNPKKSYVYMTCGLVLGTTFSIFSKENGVLVPFLILVIEFVISGKAHNKINEKLFKYWKIIFLIFPSIAILLYLSSKIDLSERPWIMRPFNQYERLLTESRIIIDYLGQIFFPEVEKHGLIQDDYVVSKSFLEPISTLFSTALILAAITWAYFYKNRYHFLSLSILFFIVGHLLESSNLGLELYFEHRNYLPTAFIFLPISVILFKDSEKISSKAKITAAFLILVFLSFLLNQRAMLWSNMDKLEAYWSAGRKSSVRAHNNIVKQMLIEGRIDDAKNHLMDAVTNVPDSAVLRLLLLLCKMGEGSASPEDFEKLAVFMQTARFDIQVFSGLQTLSDQVRLDPVHEPYANGMLLIMESAEKNPDAKSIPSLLRLTAHNKMLLWLSLGQWDNASNQLEKIMKDVSDVETAIGIAMEFVKYKQYQIALNIWPAVKNINNNSKDKKDLNKKNYDIEIIEIEKNLKRDINK